MVEQIKTWLLRLKRTHPIIFIILLLIIIISPIPPIP